MKKKYLILFSLSGFLISIDQLIKIYVHTQFRLGESISIIPNFLNLTYVRNFGAAFGFLAQSHPGFREVFFLVLPPLAVLIIIMIMRSLDDKETGQAIALSSVCGGALGNYLDRLQYRYVIDFVDIHFYNKYSWPAFNIADMAIVLGVCFLLFQLMMESVREKREKKNQPATIDRRE